MSAPPKVNAGVSLIELLVVLSIVGVLATVGIYYMQGKVPSAVRGQTSELAGALRNAQLLAMKSGQQIYLRTTGGGKPEASLEWGYRTIDSDTGAIVYGTAMGRWIPERATANYCQVGVGLNDFSNVSPSPKNVLAIKAHLEDPDTTFKNVQFFTGNGATPVFFFDTNGLPNSEFFITIAGLTKRLADPVGLVTVARSTGIQVFVKRTAGDAGSPWQRY